MKAKDSSTKPLIVVLVFVKIRVSRGGVTFAAPVLIVHYIQEHSYLPPGEFLKAVEEAVD